MQSNDNIVRFRDTARLSTVSPRAKRKSKAKSMKKGKVHNASQK
jgi:hypothetical protein